MRLTGIGLVVLVVILAGCSGGPGKPPPEAQPTDTPPSFSGTVENQTYMVGRTIRPLTLPAATGGNGSLHYSLTPTVPGLSFDQHTRTLRGTPEMKGVYDLIYRVEDSDDNSSPSDVATIGFSITVNPATLVAGVVSSVRIEEADGVLSFEALPGPSGGPTIVEVLGNHVVTNGGAFFLDVFPAFDRRPDKLLVSIDDLNGERDEARFGYYEIDLPDTATASSYRLVGQMLFELDPQLSTFCLSITAVDKDGAAGRPVCHAVEVAPVGAGEVQVTLSWDADSDLDLHVVDPNGEEIYYLATDVESGGELDLESNPGCAIDSIRNEHVSWTRKSPPPGTYVVRLDHWSNCGVPETNYEVSVYNSGETSTFSGTFTGEGERGGRGSGEEITTFTVPGGGPPPVVRKDISSNYRGNGNQVFTLNPDGEVLADTLFTLQLGEASAEVYVIATNTAHYRMQPRIERLDVLEAAAKGIRPSANIGHHQPQPRPEVSDATPDRPWVTGFNNDPFRNYPMALRDGDRRARLTQQSTPAITEGDTFSFLDIDRQGEIVEIPATARRVVTDGVTTVAVWVADDDWGDCEECVNREMTSALAERFLQPGAYNDIRDWVTAIFGEPWGPHGSPALIPPEAADVVHILLFDIEDDGVPQPGEARLLGFFFGKDVFRRFPFPPFSASNERLMFYLDAPFLTVRDGATWDVTDRLPSVMIATLAHEFQHMIHLYQKPVLRGTISEAWLNEMSSEVAEDLIADKMMTDGPRAVAYDDPSAGDPENVRGRLPGYNLYNDSQVTRWDGRLANYSVNYALGAYLARTYGGAALFGAIVQSDQTGIHAIERALNDLGHEPRFGQTLVNWAIATLLSDDTGAPVPYRYNPGTWSTSQTGGLAFRLGSINLFNYVYGPPRVPARLAYEGPYLHSLQSFNDRTQPPHSNMYTTLGRNSGTVRLRVDAGTDNRITVVVKE